MITRWLNHKCPWWWSAYYSRKIDSEQRKTLNAGDQLYAAEVPSAVLRNDQNNPILFQMARLNDFYEFRKAAEPLAPPNHWDVDVARRVCPAGWPDSGPDRRALCAQFVCCRFTFWNRRLRLQCSRSRLINPRSSVHLSISIWFSYFVRLANVCLYLCGNAIAGSSHYSKCPERKFDL